MMETLRVYLFQFSDTGNHIDKTINEKKGSDRDCTN